MEAQSQVEPIRTVRGPVIVLGLLAMVLLFAGAMAAAGLWSLNRDSASRPAEAQVEMLSADPVSWVDGGIISTEVRNGFRVQYSYVVNGKTYKGISPQNSRYVPGDTYKVCYDPANPERNSLMRSDFVCGSPKFFR